MGIFNVQSNAHADNNVSQHEHKGSVFDVAKKRGVT